MLIENIPSRDIFMIDTILVNIDNVRICTNLKPDAADKTVIKIMGRYYLKYKKAY